MTTAPAVNHLLERAVVKVLINIGSSKDPAFLFKGSGFFISPDYVLTAHHCLETLVDGQEIYVENQTYGRMRVILEREKSYPSQAIDIAVLKLVTKIEITDYLPLGLITEHNFDNEILAVGYPSEDFQLVRGRIHGVSSKIPQFYTDVTKAKGQSGSPVYHLEMNRVVGIALNLESGSQGGLAGRFDVLLRQWTELESLNQQAIDRWDKLLQPKPLLSKPIVMTWGGVIAAVVLGVWLLLGRGCQLENTIIKQEVGKEATGVVNTGSGNVTIGK